MKKRHVLLLLAIPLAAFGYYIYSKKSQPPPVPFARANRETLISSLNTNGKVEPLEYASVRTDMRGLVIKLLVKQGQTVARGAVLAELRAPDLEAQLAAAQARREQAKAAMADVERGGQKSALADIDASLARAKLDRDAAQRDYNALRRLEEKQAATREEVENARGKLRQAELAIEGLVQKRAALVTASDRSVAEANLRQAEADVDLARRQMADATVRSPIAGVIYSLPIRLGSYLNPGDPVADVGRLDRLRVRVYVDEPELGRVSKDLPVTITWDALRGKQWQGTVEQLPTEIKPLGTRQVGEVLCTIENPGLELVPGTNVNVQIRSQVVTDALTIPTEAMRHDSGGAYVFILSGDTVGRRTVTTGASSINRVQILSGLNAGDAVALPTDLSLHDGMSVSPVYP
ncbi:MAG TPA: efflux RND transporter periplasmic adaptor subunit [Bryobacteraceae bacterium]|nr:efflux RND transporter periplasmic adaptor subunit [Bryobacteraceae bacterium]